VQLIVHSLFNLICWTVKKVAVKIPS
jgi:hypothetical protein